MRVLSYYGVHYRLRTRRGPAAGYRCCGCGLLAYTWAYDHKDPNEVTDDRGATYSLDLAHYQPMCVRCHFRFDAPFKPSYQSGKRTLASPEYPTPADRELAEAAGLWPPPPPPAYHPDEELPLRWSRRSLSPERPRRDGRHPDAPAGARVLA